MTISKELLDALLSRVERPEHFFGDKGSDEGTYLFHPGRSHRPSPLCIFHGKIGFG
jgi:hypothetical protein